MDALNLYNQVREQLEQAGDEDETLQAQMDEAKQDLVQQAQEVLGPRLTINNAVLNQLQQGEVGFSDAVGNGDVQFNYDVQDRGGDEAAELLSALTEIEETDPALAKSISGAIARSKIESVLASAPTEEKKKEPTAEERAAESKVVTERALALRNSTTDLTAYLASPDVSEYAAADAVMELAVIDPKQAERTLGKLPTDKVSEMTVGLLSLDRSGVLSLTPPAKAGQLVRRQLRNDKNPEHGFSDRNNMSAPYLLWKFVEEHATALQDMRSEAAAKQKELSALQEKNDPANASRVAELREGLSTLREEIEELETKNMPNKVLAAVGVKTIEDVISRNYDDESFMAEQSVNAQAELQAYWEAHSDEVKELVGVKKEEAVTTPQAPTVDLDKQVDLDNI